jgi:hypothetical protein
MSLKIAHINREKCIRDERITEWAQVWVAKQHRKAEDKLRKPSSNNKKNKRHEKTN